MKRKVLSRRQFLERMGTLAGLGAAYYGMAESGLLPLVASLYRTARVRSAQRRGGCM